MKSNIHHIGCMVVGGDGAAWELARRTGKYAADATEDNIELKIKEIAVDPL